MALVFVSCATEQTIEVNRVNDEIKFAVVTEAATKAADVYCNNNLPDEFTVYANHGGKTYIDGHVIVRDGSAWKNTNGVRYWPEPGEVTFYAYHNAGTFNWTSGEVPTVHFTVENAVADQVDFIYAVKTQVKNDNPVALNFRHALSQIVFQAKNTNPNLYVEISGVSVCNVGKTNTFTYPSANTSGNVVNHDGTGATTIGDQGTWAALTGGEADYSVTFAAVPVAGNGTVCALTSASTPGEFNANTMLLLPQTTTAWVPANNTPATGSYFLVTCKIYNVAGASYVSGSDVCVFDGRIAIPAAFTWEQGKKYIYTFVFGNGNAGYIPDNDDSALIPIEYNVTVDDFVPVTADDTDMVTNS